MPHTASADQSASPSVLGRKGISGIPLFKLLGQGNSLLTTDHQFGVGYQAFDSLVKLRSGFFGALYRRAFHAEFLLQNRGDDRSLFWPFSKYQYSAGGTGSSGDVRLSERLFPFVVGRSHGFVNARTKLPF